MTSIQYMRLETGQSETRELLSMPLVVEAHFIPLFAIVTVQKMHILI